MHGKLRTNDNNAATDDDTKAVIASRGEEEGNGEKCPFYSYELNRQALI